MIDILTLKNKILRLAFEGKLTERLPSDSSIDLIIERCKKDKEKSVINGKSKKELFRGGVANPLYTIPQEWRWLYISDMSLFQEGPGILAVNFRNNGVPLIRLSGMDGQTVSLNGCNYLDPEMVNEKWNHFRLDAGDILISSSASLDRISEVDESAEGAIPYTGLIRFKLYGGISKEYFKWFIQSPYYIEQVNKQKKGGFISHYGPTHLRKMMIPIPSVEEQKRIADRINAAFVQIDIIDALQQQYQFDRESLKGKIIDAGICGKLTEQLPEDGNAEDLYVQIQKEKAKLIKEGKIKKEKPLPEISDDEIPFEIPSNWKWVRWGNIVNVVSARRVHQADWRDEGIPFYRAREIAVLADTGVVNNDLYISEGLYNDFSESGVPQAGDLMVTGVGTLGKTYVVQENDRFYYKDASVLCFENYANVNSDFLKRVMESRLMRSQINSNSGGTTVDTLTMVRMNQYVLPLPPREEQKRIAETIEQTLELLS